MINRYTMSPAAREEWKTWLTARASQKKVAIALFGVHPGGKVKNTTEVNRAYAGEPDILEKWFERLPHLSEKFAVELEIGPDKLRAKLATLVIGERRDAPWHPAFPTVQEEDALIPAPLEALHGSSHAEVARSFVNRLPPQDRWSAKSVFKDRLELVGPDSASRRIAVQQLRAAVEEDLRQRVELAREVARKREVELEPVEWSVEVGGESDQPERCQVLVVGKDLPKDPGWFPPPVRLGTWGPEQAVGLARKLSGSRNLPAAARVSLATFASSLEAHPSWTSPVLEPNLVVGWLAEVAREGPPASTSKARGLLTAAAWRRCQAAAKSGSLDELGEELPDKLFAQVAERSRTPEEIGPWTRIPRGEALRLIAQALDSSLDGRGRAEILELVDALSSSSPGHEKRIAELREAVVGASPADLLDQLIAGGYLRAARRDTIESVEPEVAAAHAARRLGSAQVIAAHPELLVDPHGLFLVDELARYGVHWAEFAEATDKAPPELVADVALARLRFAWCSEHGVPPAELTTTWAAVLWSVAHGLYAREPHGVTDRWTRNAQSLLKEISWRFRAVLPLLGAEPVEDLRPLVPGPVVDLVARWRRTPAMGEPDREPETAELLGFSLAEFRGRDDLDNAVRTLAPAQVHPARSWWFWRMRELRVPGVQRLQEVAVAGDPEAFEILTGQTWLREAGERDVTLVDPRRKRPATEQWFEIPPSIRLAWAIEHGPRGSDGWRVYKSIIQGLTPQSRGQSADRPPLNHDDPFFGQLVDLGALLNKDQVGTALAETLTPGRPGHTGWFPTELAWELAERLELTDLLEELAAWPDRVVGSLGLDIEDHRIKLSWGEKGHFQPLKPTWVPMDRSRYPGQPSPLRRVTLGVDEIVAEWRMLAMRAAAALARLGRLDPLLALWNAARVVHPPAAVREQVAAFEGLLAAIEHPDLYVRDVAPIADLQALAPETSDSDASTGLQAPEWQVRWQVFGLRGTDTLGLARDPWVLPEVRNALRGLVSLLQVAPESYPSAVREWLRGVQGPSVVYFEGEHDHIRRDQTRSAALYLLEAGHQAPLQLWAEGLHLYREEITPSAKARSNAEAVNAWVAEDRSRLDRLWKLLHRHPDQLEQSVFDELRNGLLHSASYRSDFRDSASIRPGCPRHFVVQHAMNDLVAADWLHQQNSGSTRWAPVLRMHYDKAPDRRSAARWAVRLGASEPGCPELVDALRYWLLTDPAPWAGPLDWEGPGEGGRFEGGTFELLDLALGLNEDWVADGLVRVWRDGLTRPWLGFDGHKLAEAAEGWWHDNSDFFSMPILVRKLVDGLIARGRADVVVEAWPSPALFEPATERHDTAVSREQKLRMWLERIAPKHAPAVLLQARVDDWLATPGVRPFPAAEAWELFERGSPGIEVAAATLASSLAHPQLAMLARTAPQELVRVAEDRIRRGEDHRYLTWLLLAETNEPGGESPMAAAAARRSFFERSDG